MKSHRTWIVLFVVALTLRIVMVFFWEHRVGPDRFYFGDSDTYWQLGKAVAAGAEYDYGGNRIHRMPGYPVLLAPLFLVFGPDAPILAGRLENALIGSLTVLAVAWLALLVFKDRTLALVAGWITAVDPLNIVMSALVLSEAPFCLAMIVQMALWVKALGPDGRLDWRALTASGLAAAAAVYCRPSWLYFVPFAMLPGMLLGLRNFDRIKTILKSGLVVTAVLAVCLLPWWYRNYRMTGHLVTTTLQAGPSLYDGLSPEATGASNMEFVERFRNAELRLGPVKGRETLEYRLNQKMRQAAINWAWKHPKLAWKLARSKFVRLWNVWPNEETLAGGFVSTIVFCTYCPVLVLGLFGAARSLGKGFSVQLLWIPAVYITALHIVFVSSIRYRAPAMMTLAILAAWVLVDLGRVVRAPTRKLAIFNFGMPENSSRERKRPV